MVDDGPGPLLVERGIELSATQVYRLVTQTPERLSLRILMALCDALGCTSTDLIEPVADGGTRLASVLAAGAGDTVGEVRGVASEAGPDRPRPVTAAVCTTCARSGLVLSGGRCGTCNARSRQEPCAGCAAGAHSVRRARTRVRRCAARARSGARPAG